MADEICRRQICRIARLKKNERVIIGQVDEHALLMLLHGLYLFVASVLEIKQTLYLHKTHVWSLCVTKLEKEDEEAAHQFVVSVVELIKEMKAQLLRQ